MPFYQYRNREIQRKTCLRGFGGREFVLSAVFAAETLKEHTQTFEAGKFYVPIGSFLTRFTAKYNNGKEELGPEPTKVKIYEKAGTNADAVQTLTLAASKENKGSFTLSFGGQTTAPIKVEEEGEKPTGAEIVAALVKLSTIATSANIESPNAAKTMKEEAIKIKFIGELGNRPQPLLVVDNSGMESKESKGKITAATTTPGTTAEKIIGVYDGPEWDFWGNEASNENLDQPIPIYFQSCVFNKVLLPEYAKYGVEAEEALKTCSFV